MIVATQRRVVIPHPKPRKIEHVVAYFECRFLGPHQDTDQIGKAALPETAISPISPSMSRLSCVGRYDHHRRLLFELGYPNSTAFFLEVHRSTPFVFRKPCPGGIPTRACESISFHRHSSTFHSIPSASVSPRHPLPPASSLRSFRRNKVQVPLMQARARLVRSPS